MWSDLLYFAERAHFARVLAWGAGSVLAGTLILLFLVVRRARSRLLLGFGVATAFWGAVQLGVALWSLRALQMRDLEGFTRFDRMLWLNLGLDAGVAAVGITLIATGWMLRRSEPLMGAGTATLVQGTAMLVLHGTTLSVLSRLAIGR